VSELRQDPISGDWVLIAPERGKRPRQVARSRPVETTPGARPVCPFCPGHESELPEILAEYSSDTPPGWTVRVSPNRFAGFRPDAEPPPEAPGHATGPAFGHQEVIIESPRHDATLHALSDTEMLDVVRAYRDRYAELIARPGIRSVTLFRNSGPGSGASLPHPHAQIIATAIRPPKLQALDDRALAYFERHSRCLMCDEIEREGEAAARIVEDNGAFVVLVPFAARYPFEFWIAPKRHQAGFDEVAEQELEVFGQTLRRSLKRLRSARGDVSYNFVIQSAVADGRGAPHLHWFLRLAPHLGERGGFELGTNLPVNPSSPEQDAAALRTAETQ